MALPPKRCNGIALAAGAGGLELGVSLAIPGYRTVCWCERDAYAAAALVARMADQALDDAPVWSDLAAFDGRPWRGKVDIITAGYPCQPFSNAGKRLGAKDPRHLWPHICRLLEETGASALIAENVLGHVSLGLEDVWRDLRKMGYALEAGIFSAAEIGASHIRKRLFLLAYAPGQFIGDLASLATGGRQALPETRQISVGRASGRYSLDLFVSDGHGEPENLFPPHAGDFGSWQSWLNLRPLLQPAVAGGHDGLAHKMDRYRLTGNGVCPLAAGYAITSLLLAAQKRQNHTLIRV